jgi:hypothetical protein
VTAADSGPEPCHDLRIQRACRSARRGDPVLVRGLNVAEPDLAQRPTGTDHRRRPLTGPNGIIRRPVQWNETIIQGCPN